MLQVPIEDADIAPGRVVEWRLVSAQGRDSNESPHPQPEPYTPPQSQSQSQSTSQSPSQPVTRATATYNQVKHFAAADEARRANDPLSTYLAGTFEIAGPLDRGALESALLRFVRRHEALRCTFQQIVGDLACDVLTPDQVALETVEVGDFDSTDEIDSYLQKSFQGIDTLSWPLITLGAVIREESTTVFFACDHLVGDGMSTPIAVNDIASSYAALARGDEPAAPEVGSYLGFSRDQRSLSGAMDADDERLGYWKSFMAGNGDFFPPFPLDLGVEPGRMYPTVNETDALLTASETEAMERACQEVDGRLFMGLLAALGVSLRKEGGPDTYRAFMPVSERGQGPYAHAMGWFINTLPIEFSVKSDDFAEVMAHARAASTEMRAHLDVPFVQAWRLLAPDHFALRAWPFAVNFFSYLDFRRAPGAEHHAETKAKKHVWASQSNGICFWFHRNHGGLYVNSIFVDTEQARITKDALGHRLKQTLENVATSGTL